MNALVKKYCNSNSEISDVIEFLEAFEKKFIFEEIKYSKQTNSQYGNHPVILAMKKSLSCLIFSKHFDQFILSHNYLCQYQNNKNGNNYYLVRNIQSKDLNKNREVKIQENHYICHCPTFNRHGLICRHIFSLVMMLQDKTLRKIRINKRWKAPSSNNNLLTSDHFDFENKGVEKTQENTENKTKITFMNIKRNKGAPKKEKRSKSVVEKKKAEKKKIKKEVKKTPKIQNNTSIKSK